VTARRARQAIPRLIHMGYLDQVTGVASPVGYVGLTERCYREARDWFEQGLLAARRLHDPMREAGLRTNLGLAQLFLDETQAAQTSFVDALRLVRKRDPDASFVPKCLLGLAVVAGRVGDRNRSARLAATAEAQLRPGNATAEDVVWRRLRGLLPEVAGNREGWDVGDHAGAALDPRAAIDTALATS